MRWKLPLFDTDFGNEEIEAVTNVLRSGWLTMGNLVREFEVEFERTLGVKHAIAVSNGTAALHLANRALGLGSGDEVICPSLTFVATANTITYVGARPVFAEVASLDEWLLSVDTIEKMRTPSTKAVCVVHYAGYPCAMDAICEYAREKKLYLIEDCAHAPRVYYKKKALGGWGDVGCFSFFSNKNMSTGEGGMVITNNDEVAENVRLLRSHGMTTLTLDRHEGHAYAYDVLEKGYNYRPTEMTAAIGLVQLRKLAQKNESRRSLVKLYRAMLSDEIPQVYIPFSRHSLKQAAPHIMPILLPKGVSRVKVMDFLKANGIQTSIHYRPVHSFSAYIGSTNEFELTLTNQIGESCLTLPLYPAMTAEDVETCVHTLREALLG